MSESIGPYLYYAHVPALIGARFVFIEEPLWKAGMKRAQAMGRYTSKYQWDISVLCAVTRFVEVGAAIVRETTDRSVVLTATPKYLRSIGSARGKLVRISMSDLRRAERQKEALCRA